MTPLLDTYITKLKRFFVENPSDRYLAHEKARPLLVEMAKDKRILNEIIKKNLFNPDYLKKTRHYSTLAMTIAEDSEFSFLLNIFPPLPNRRTDISFQSIHHHGNLILSTVAAFGPGYNSILFKQGFQINYDTKETEMEIEKDYQNQLYEVGFVDKYQPHIVFYPSTFSGTYALWSNYKKSTKDIVKKFNIIKSFKKPIAKGISFLGLGKLFGLNEIKYFDFYVQDKKIWAMEERESYIAEGDNNNFLLNIFCFVQNTGFNDDTFLIKLLDTSSTPLAAKKYIHMLLNKETIVDSFFEGHLNIPKVNLFKQDIINAMN